MRHRAQGIIEFAFISLILFTLLVGILEMGRMMFLFTQVSSAAQEGTRFGVIHPYQIVSLGEDCLNPNDNPPCTLHAYPTGAHTESPCNIVAQARARAVLIPTDPADPNKMSVEVGFDKGDSTLPKTLQTPPRFAPGTDRVVVTATYSMSFLTPLLSNFGPINLRMVSARTIMADQEDPPAEAYCPDGEPVPTPVGGQ